jgi:hypothetical protein
MIFINFVIFSGLNEELVHLLMERDELHMAQDSMLVDIEDLTRLVEYFFSSTNEDVAIIYNNKYAGC